jgi:hypothetical protein
LRHANIAIFHRSDQSTFISITLRRHQKHTSYFQRFYRREIRRGLQRLCGFYRPAIGVAIRSHLRAAMRACAGFFSWLLVMA